jgi:hypothetical protein
MRTPHREVVRALARGREAALRSLRESVGRELLWKGRSLFSYVHDLVDPEAGDGDSYATLLWRPGLMLRGRAEAQSADGSWWFQPRGFFRERVVVLTRDGEAPLATLRRYFRRAALRFEDGREYSWRRPSFWSRTWVFEDPNGTVVVRLRREWAFLRSRARVEFESSAASTSERALLACLGWYLILVAGRRAAAAAAR